MAILVIGSSGHDRVIVEILDACGHIVAGYLDDTVSVGVLKSDRPILGKLEDCDVVCRRTNIRDIVLAIGDNWSRRKVYRELKNSLDLRFPIITHPSASIAGSARIAEGSVLMPQSNVGPDTRLGKFTIVNSGASIDHDCVMGDFASVAPGVFTGGLVEIGECSAVGMGAAISDRVRIGAHSVVGTGAVVVRDIPDYSVAYGNPAVVKRSRSEGEPYYGSTRISSR